MRPIIFHPDADAELFEATEYYDRCTLGLGADLLGEVEKALEQISRSPESYQRIERRVRRKRLWRFPYSLVYAVYPDRLWIVAFAHQKRRPFYWHKRT